MLFSKLRERAQSEKGFTLIELLVVVLIIGILAAIALPAFLGQRAKAQDAEAKSDARNMVSQVESCFTDTQDYGDCLTADGTTLPGPPVVKTGLPAQVKVSQPAGSDYSILSTSKSGHTFTITKSAATGESTRTSVGGTW